MSELRTYQANLLEVVESRLRPHASVMLQLATGAGKTVWATHLLDRFLARHPYSVCAWLTHRRELRKQSGNVLESAGLLVSHLSDLPCGERVWAPGVVNVVSPSMRKGWPVSVANAGVLVVDEAHHTPSATWSHVIDMWRTSGGIVIGLTATPWRLKKSEGFEGWFGELICGPSMLELQQQTFLATPIVVTPTHTTINVDGVKLIAGDFNEAELGHRVIKMLQQKTAIEYWVEYTKGMTDKRTLWFCPNVESAFVLTRRLTEHNAGAARTLTGTTPADERDSILHGLSTGKVTHLVSVNVLCEGVDMPSVPIVALMRPTKSLVTYLQSTGRCSRPKNTTDGGVYHVLDYAQNSVEHGLPDLAREWSLKPSSTLKNGKQKEPPSFCVDGEEHKLHPSTRTCTHCQAPQYQYCVECQRERRWTRYNPNAWRSDKPVCVECAKAKEQKRKAATPRPIALMARSRQSVTRSMRNPQQIENWPNVDWYASPNRDAGNIALSAGDKIIGQIHTRSGYKRRPVEYVVLGQNRYGDHILAESADM